MHRHTNTCTHTHAQANLFPLSAILGQGYVDLSSLTTLTHLPPSSSLPHTTTVNLILPPHSLSPHLAHTFQLSATNEAGISSSRVSITADPSPHSATLSLSPLSGVALDTLFSLSVTGALDSTNDSPLLYQFSLSNSEGSVVWLSGVQVEPRLQTILPSGPEPRHNLSVVARVFDRSGGFSDVWASATVEPANTVSVALVQDLLTDIETHYSTHRDWQNLLSGLVSIALEINSTPSLSSSASLRDYGLSLLLEVFRSDLPASHTHYQLAAQLLSLLTHPTTLTSSTTDTVIAAVVQIGSFFRGQSEITQTDTQPVASGNGDDEPLQLLPVESVASPSMHLPITVATDLLATWSNLIPSKLGTPADLPATSVEAIQELGVTLCQGLVYGESPLLVTSPSVEVVVHKAPPTGQFNVSGEWVEFGHTLEREFEESACPEGGQACFESCLLGVKYQSDLFSEDFFQLTATAGERIISEIEGSNPQAVELGSSVLSVSISIPAQNGFLHVADLEQEFVVLFRVRDSELANGSIPLCLYREMGGSHGFSMHLWQIDSTSSPSLITLDSINYYQCSYSHLTEFAVGILPPPFIPPPPPPTPTPTPSPSPSPSHSPTPTPPTVEPPSVQPQAGISPAIIVIPLLLVILIVAAVVCIVIILLFWKKKRKKVLKISPDAGTSGVAETDGRPTSKRSRTGPLTPEESKVPMPIIELQEGGKRAVIGSMNVLPSIRLRELRYHIHDQFPGFKSKPFYFLTRQLVDIEPPTEQQQFVSLVYGDEADKPVFLRRIETTTELTRLHFCVCGNAAQFECSSCSTQGYCSPECQTSDWVERHQRECGRLGERKQRMSVLRRQTSSTALSPVDEQNRLPPIFPERQSVSAATPLDFRSLLNSQRSYQRTPFASSQSLEPSVATPSLTSPAKPPLPPLTTPRKPTLPTLTSPTKTIPTSLVTPSKHTLPPLTTPPRPTRTTLSMLAGRSQPPTIEEENEEEVGGPTPPAYRPAMATRRLTPLTGTPSLTSPMAQFTPAHFQMTSPPHSTPITTSQPPRLFQRFDPTLRTSLNPQQQQQPQEGTESRKISIQSLGGPVEYSLTSPPSQSLRERAKLKQDSEDSSSSSESESESGDGSSSTRPTSAAAAHSHSVPGKKRTSTEKARANTPSSSSSSSESDGSGEESSDTQPSTPLVTDKH